MNSPPQPGRKRLFAYGTLMDREIWCAVTGIERPATPAILRGFARYCVAGCDYPGIVATGNHEDLVDGCIYEDINARVFQRLDHYEDTFYQRTEVQATVEKGACPNVELLCQAYIVPQTNQHLLTTRPWDFHRFCHESRERYLASLLRNF